MTEVILQNLDLVINIACGIGGFVVTAIPTGIALIKAIKDRKAAKTEAEKEKANSDLITQAETFIKEAETLYASVNTILKSQGLSAGEIKKDTVMTKLQAYAMERGYTFDVATWANKIDEIVELTRKVNSK